MKRILPVILVVLAAVLIGMATVHTSELKPATTPEGAVQSLLSHVKGRDFAGAFNYVSKSSNTDQPSFAKDLSGRDGSLLTQHWLAGASRGVFEVYPGLFR